MQQSDTRPPTGTLKVKMKILPKYLGKTVGINLCLKHVGGTHRASALVKVSLTASSLCQTKFIPSLTARDLPKLLSPASCKQCACKIIIINHAEIKRYQNNIGRWHYIQGGKL